MRLKANSTRIHPDDGGGAPGLRATLAAIQHALAGERERGDGRLLDLGVRSRAERR
jgi:hypothetical protein